MIGQNDATRIILEMTMNHITQRCEFQATSSLFAPPSSGGEGRETEWRMAMRLSVRIRARSNNLHDLTWLDREEGMNRKGQGRT